MGSFPDKGVEVEQAEAEMLLDLDMRKTAPMISEPLTPLKFSQ